MLFKISTLLPAVTLYPPPSSGDSFVVDDSEVAAAIGSFPAGSSAGLDALRPQHLKDMVAEGPMDVSLSPLLLALAS